MIAKRLCQPRFHANSDESLNVRNFVPASTLTRFSNILWYSVLIQCAFVGTKAEFSISYMKTKMLAGLLVAATLAVAPGVALAHGGGGGSHGGGGGSHGGGGFAHHGSVSDRSFHFGRGFRHDDDRFFDHRFVFGNPWPGYYDPYYLRAYDDYTVAVQRALAQLGYYHGPVDGVVGPQTEEAIRWFQSVDRLPLTGEIDFATLRALRIG
jgi:Putative peptidoglycan binding domain